MGYYTKFEIEISGEGDNWVTGVDRDGNVVEVNTGIDHDAVLQEITDLSGYHSLTEEPIKWYEYDENMREVSIKYPALLFTLHGEGEASDDLWCAYYQNGKCQRVDAEITYAPHDPTKMK
jgi:hypothetical protein